MARASTVRAPVTLQEGKPVTPLGYAEGLKSRMDAASGLMIEIPESLQQETNRRCKMAWVFRIPKREPRRV